MVETVTLEGNYGYDDYRATGLKSTVVDASAASWTLANIGSPVNPYPFSVYDSANVTLTGGTINGRVSQTLDWQDAYVNSAGVFVRDTVNAVITDWRISKAWDGIRVRGDEGDTFTIDGVWLSDIRDDGIENDEGLSGTIRNSLLDGVFAGISTADRQMSNQSDELVSIDHVLIRMETFLYKGKDTHVSPLKVYSTSPRMEITNTIIAIEDPGHVGKDALERAWDKTVKSSGNYFLNLSDEPLPKGYPMPPAGFTVLQGAKARAFWEEARADWIDDPDGAANAPQLPDQEDGEATAGADSLTGDGTANWMTGLKGNDTLLGQGGNDTLIGNEGNDVLRGEAGNDLLDGRLGSDVLIGGGGNDVFRFASVTDSSIAAPDVIRAGDGAVAFEGVGGANGDVIDLRGVDADAVTGGNQEFDFGSTGRMGLSATEAGDGNTLVRGNTDGDAAFEFAFVIEDASVRAASYTAADFIL